MGLGASEILHQLMVYPCLSHYIFVGFQPSKVVQDFATIHSRNSLNWNIWFHLKAG
jgi:hypothetical protein